MRKLIWIAVALAGCGDSKKCDLNNPSMGCSNGQVCEDVGGAPTCATPVVVRGKVTDPAGAPIANALVTALDANDAPASPTAKTDAAGNYELPVPVARTAADKPGMMQIKLRAAAAGFETFPLGIRRSLPIELAQAVAKDGKLVVQTAQTDIVLFPVMNASGLGSIYGTVKNEAGKSGALIVAQGPAVFTGVSDSNGGYEIFNLPPGAYTLTAYRATVNFAPAMATVAAGQRALADINKSGAATANVTGAVNIVAATDKLTSIVLVPAATFNDILKRGEVPPGLRAPKSGPPSITEQFTIEAVPDGTYKVLAAFENDRLVRDPDPGIAGTQIVEITVAGATIMLPTQFKITQAIEVFFPGAGDIPEPVAGNPTFDFAIAPSGDRYTVEVYDGKGNVILQPTNTPDLGTSGHVKFTYPGNPALVKGQYYQFKAVAYRQGGTKPISSTEDLKGVWIAD